MNVRTCTLLCIAFLSLKLGTPFSCTRTKFWHEQQFKQVNNAQFDVLLNLAVHSADIRIFMYSVTSTGGLTQTLQMNIFSPKLFFLGGDWVQARCSPLPPSHPVRFSWYNTQHPHVETHIQNFPHTQKHIKQPFAKALSQSSTKTMSAGKEGDKV